MASWKYLSIMETEDDEPYLHLGKQDEESTRFYFDDGEMKSFTVERKQMIEFDERKGKRDILEWLKENGEEEIEDFDVEPIIKQLREDIDKRGH